MMAGRQTRAPAFLRPRFAWRLFWGVWTLLSLGAGAGLSPAKADEPRQLRLQQMTIDKTAREIRLHTRIAIREGILEYLLVGADGKTYESVFQVAENKPSDLAFALLLIGVEPLSFERFTELRGREDGEAMLLAHHRKSLVTIEFFAGSRRLAIGRFIRCRESDPPPLHWVFTGGGFLPDNRYAADQELSFIAIWTDPAAPVNLFSSLNNPYRGPYGYEMNAESPELNSEFIDILIRRVP